MYRRDGGGDQEFNPRLRTIIAKGKAANMPNDNIEAIAITKYGQIWTAAITEQWNDPRLHAGGMA